MSNQPPPPSEPGEGDQPSWPSGPPTDEGAGQPPTSPPAGAPPPGGPATPPGDGGTVGGGMPAPPPPPPSGETGMILPDGSYSAMEAVKFGWRATLGNIGLLVGAGAVFLLGTFLLGQVLALVAMPSQAELAEVADEGLGALLSAAQPPWWTTVFSSLISTLLLIPLVRAALAVTAGREVSFGDLFGGDNIGQVAIVAIILGLLSGIVSTLPLLGFLLGLVVNFLTAYAIFFVIADGRDAIDGLRASARFALDNVGPLLLLIILSIFVGFAGFLACIVGIFVAVPVIYVAQAYTFRFLRGEAVASM